MRQSGGLGDSCSSSAQNVSICASFSASSLRESSTARLQAASSFRSSRSEGPSVFGVSVLNEYSRSPPAGRPGPRELVDCVELVFLTFPGTIFPADTRVRGRSAILPAVSPGRQRRRCPAAGGGASPPLATGAVFGNLAALAPTGPHQICLQAPRALVPER